MDRWEHSGMARQFTPKSRRTWRAWLEQHHDSEAEVWLIFYKRHTGKPTVSYNDAVEEAVCFGWIDGLKRRIDESRYAHRFTPRKPDSKWSKTNQQRAARMEKAGRMTAAGRAAIATAKRRGTWRAAANTPDVTADMPEELAALLRGNAQAAEFFESLAPSYQRQFLLWINVAKRELTRRKRIEEAIALLSRGEKLGMR
ncbi:MAG TPA: YdeI/OmpD-associated family protein [Gammaproteobacteria bacterium]|nr:YdeI/OmpD-associated family protein [Gammaproteobacteria bacterium]